MNLATSNPLDKNNHPLNPPPAPITDSNQSEIIFVEKYADAQAFADHVNGTVFTEFRKSTMHYFCPSTKPGWPVMHTTFLSAASEFRRPEPSTVSEMFFEILAADQPALSEFYSGLFGWEYEQGSGGPTKAFNYVKGTAAGAIRGGVGHAHGETVGSDAAFYVVVENVAESLQKALDLGAELSHKVTPVDGYRFAEFLDPEQNRVGLVEKFPKQLVER